MSDTPRTDEATFQILSSLQSGTDNVVYQPFARQLERELAAVTADLEFRRELGALQQQEYDKVTAERDVLKADLCAFAVDMERQLSAVTAERDSMVARFRDEINQRQETQRANAIVDAAILSASQQETRRLREALEKYRDALSDGPENCSFSKYEEVDEIARESLSSTPAPVRSDTEKLKKVKSALEWISESCSGHASTLAREALTAIDAELAKEGVSS